MLPADCLIAYHQKPSLLKVECWDRSRYRTPATIHDKMITTILIATLCLFMARIFLSNHDHTYPLTNFPEIARGHTCVHLLTPSGTPYSPAVMFFQQSQSTTKSNRNRNPIFIDLYTNKTVSHYKNFRRIYMTSPVYQRRSLHQTLRGKPLFEIMSPAVRKIFDDRNTTWWNRCHRHWLEFRSR